MLYPKGGESMHEIKSELLSIICTDYSSVPNTVKVYYLIDNDGYKVYRPFNGCDKLGGTNPCSKCIKYIQQLMLNNTLDTSVPIYLPKHL